MLFRVHPTHIAGDDVVRAVVYVDAAGTMGHARIVADRIVSPTAAAHTSEAVTPLSASPVPGVHPVAVELAFAGVHDSSCAR